MARKRGLKVALLDYLRENVDRAITLDELERELQHDRGSISSTVSKMIKESEFPVESVGAGIYRWNSNGKTKDQLQEGDLMEIMLVGRGGKILLKDGLGSTWVARQIDLEEL